MLAGKSRFGVIFNCLNVASLFVSVEDNLLAGRTMNSIMSLTGYCKLPMVIFFVHFHIRTSWWRSNHCIVGFDRDLAKDYLPTTLCDLRHILIIGSHSITHHISFHITTFQVPVTNAGERKQTAAAPGPSGPLNITAVLEKAGQFSTLIRLMKSTQIADQINNQLNNSNSGITVFAPTDNAFSSLPAGTLNSLTDQQKVALIQFHIIPSVITMPQFQTVSNPLRTQAGNSNDGQYPLNITSAGNQVNISTGVVKTTVSNTLYSGGQLAVYQVDKVLLPLAIFGTAAPAPAPEPDPSKSKKKAKAADEPTASPSKQSADVSSGFRFEWFTEGMWAVFVISASFFWLDL